MSDFLFSIATDESEFIEYERGLYTAFSNRLWHRDNWIFLGEDRVKTKIPYETQTVYLARKGGEIVGGAAINWDRNGELQLEAHGFAVAGKESESFCEGLAMYFSNLQAEETFKAMDLFDYIINDIKGRGVKTFYDVCTKEVLTMFRLLGFEVIGEQQVGEEVEYFIALNVDDA